MAPKKEKQKSNKASPKDTKAPSKPTGKAPLPFFLDFTFSVANLVIVLVGFVTCGLSLYSGANLLVSTLRGALAIFSIGLTTWMIGFVITRNSIEGVQREMRKNAQGGKGSHPGSMEFEA